MQDTSDWGMDGVDQEEKVPGNIVKTVTHLQELRTREQTAW